MNPPGRKQPDHHTESEHAMTAPTFPQIVEAFESEYDRTTTLAMIGSLADRAAEHVKKRTTVTTPVGAHADFSDAVDLFAARKHIGEWEGSFQIMADELTGTALEGIGHSDAGGIVEVLWVDEDDAHRHTKGMLIEADSSNLIFADEATIDREYVLALGLSA